MGELVHLTKRFFGSIRPGPPAADDEAWARSRMLPEERAIWERMSNPDRRHAVTVARAVVAAWPALGAGPEPERAVVAAALLHDSGKILSGLRTPARVVATVVWAVASDDVIDRWDDGSSGGLRSRLARYRRHPELGAELLRAAGSDRLTWSWAGEHHLPEQRWTVPIATGRVLKACDAD